MTIIEIPCQSGNASDEQLEARVETTATGVRWTITGKLAEAIEAAQPARPERHKLTKERKRFASVGPCR